MYKIMFNLDQNENTSKFYGEIIELETIRDLKQMIRRVVEMPPSHLFRPSGHQSG